MGRKVKVYINLTNGLEYFKYHPEIDADQVCFMRLQSTHCEQKLWQQVLASVPDDMLFRLALGYKIIVIDYGKRNPTSRALWQGIELLKYMLNRMWFGKEYMPETRAVSDSGEYFASVYEVLRKDRRIRRRFEYFKRYLQTTHLDIEYFSSLSTIDTHWDEIMAIVKRLAE